MKKNLFFATLGLSLVLFIISCTKSDTTPPASTTPEGKWVGFITYVGGPSRYFAVTFKSGGVVLVEANSDTAPDIANGTWSMASDSVRATFTYVGGTAATFSMAGKYSSSSKIMDGTIGTGSSTSGSAVFTATKQ
jgi:hypothetical protein